MKKCKRCGSYAINHNLHGRDGSDNDVCDVCYWRKRSENVSQPCVAVDAIKSCSNCGSTEEVDWKHCAKCWEEK